MIAFLVLHLVLHFMYDVKQLYDYTYVGGQTNLELHPEMSISMFNFSCLSYKSLPILRFDDLI